MKPALGSRWWLPALLAVTAVAGINGLGGPLQFDDHLLATDASTQDWGAWWQSVERSVRPLLKASFVASHHLGAALDDIPLGHHLINLGVHLLAVALAFVLTRDVCTTVLGLRAGAATTAAAVGSAGILALHPLGTEAVVYISGRSVALATLLGLAALVLHVRGARAGAAACVAAAVLAREAMFVWPLLLLLWEWSRKDLPTAAWSPGRLRQAVRATLPSALAAALTLGWLFTNGGYANLIETSRVISQGRGAEPLLLPALEYFSARLLLLAPLSIDPDLAPFAIGRLHRSLLALLLCAALYGAWRVRRSRPHVLFGLAWILVCLAPMYLVPLRHDAVSERHFYPALLGVGVIIAGEAARIAAQRAFASRVVAWVGVLALAVFFVGTILRNADYASEVALWESAAAASPAKPRVFHNLGVAYMEQQDWARSIASFQRALELDPGYRMAQDNLDRASVKQRTGNPAAEPEI